MDKNLTDLKGLEYLLECIKQYQRPILSVIFGGVICFVFYQCVTGKMSCESNSLVSTILYLMASYMGVYGIGRSFEKVSSPAYKPTNDRIKEEI